MDFIKLKSRAKINITLDVLRRREDGYHDLEMIMQTLSLHDKVYIKKIEKDEIILKTNLNFLPTDERNLAYKAAKVMKQKFNIKDGVYVELTKKIPVAAGLAGGSGNCAAVLKGMNELFNLGISEKDLMEIGFTLGSDVPYCIAEGTAVVSGRGEVVEKISSCPPFYVLLAKPREGLSTAFVYKNLNLKEVEKRPDTQKMVEAIKNSNKEYIGSGLVNVLETVSIRNMPIIGDIKEYIKSLGEERVLMSGSGPTVFALFDREEKAFEMEKAIKEKFNLKDVFVTKIEDRD